MNTYADISKYLASRKGRWEKKQDSPIEAERNTANRMIDRIDSRFDELFTTQEEHKKMLGIDENTPMKGFGDDLLTRLGRVRMSGHLPNGRYGITRPFEIDGMTGPARQADPYGFMDWGLDRDWLNTPVQPAPGIPVVNGEKIRRLFGELNDGSPARTPARTQPKVDPMHINPMKAKPIEPIKKNIPVQNTPGIRPASEKILPKVRNKTPWDDILDTVGDVAQFAGPALAEFAIRNKAIHNMEAPQEPLYSPGVKLNKAMDTSADENMVKRMIRSRKLNANRNAPNAQTAMGEYSKATADGMNMYNQINQQKNNYRAQMENSEAGMNFQNNAQNTYLANRHLEDMTEFQNNKTNARVGNTTNLINKVNQGLLERRMSKHDLKKLRILMAKYSPEVQDALRDLID